MSNNRNKDLLQYISEPLKKHQLGVSLFIILFLAGCGPAGQGDNQNPENSALEPVALPAPTPDYDRVYELRLYEQLALERAEEANVQRTITPEECLTGLTGYVGEQDN